MTVRELVRMLNLIPEEYQDMKVVDSSYNVIEGYWELLEEHPLGDYANPKCRYENVIHIE